jgi:hypothetical protein
LDVGMNIVVSEIPKRVHRHVHIFNLAYAVAIPGFLANNLFPLTRDCMFVDCTMREDDELSVGTKRIPGIGMHSQCMCT